MSLHTDGPWEVIAAEFKDDGIVAYEIKMTEAIISKANANLIAAAPEMLAALKAIQKELIGDRNSTNMTGPAGIACDMVRAAIAKAEGKTV